MDLTARWDGLMLGHPDYRGLLLQVLASRDEEPDESLDNSALSGSSRPDERNEAGELSRLWREHGLSKEFLVPAEVVKHKLASLVWQDSEPGRVIICKMKLILFGVVDGRLNDRGNSLHQIRIS